MLVALSTLLAACASGGDGIGTPPPVPTREASFDTTAIEEAMTATLDAGAPAVLVEVRDGDEVWRSARGTSAVVGGAVADPLAAVRVASVTKSMMGVLLMQLVEDGDLDLDTRIERYLPGVVDPAQPVTVRQLANHTSGMPDYIDTFPLDDPTAVSAMLTAEYTPQELIERVADVPWLSDPGTEFHYSNTNYLVLTLLIEELTGESLPDVLAERVAGPGALESTSLPLDTSMPEGAAHGYFTTNGIYVDVTEQSGSLWWGAGGVVSTVGDINTFYRGLFQGTYLPDEAVSELIDLGPVGYGLGIQGHVDPCPAPEPTATPVETTSDPVAPTDEATADGGATGDAAGSPSPSASSTPLGVPGMTYGHLGSGLGYRILSFSSPDGERQVTVSWTASPPDYGDDPRLAPAWAVVDAALTATCHTGTP